jgi:TonB-linked SusC/RagA family outer membrane protein
MKRATFRTPLCATGVLALVVVSFGEALAQSAVVTGKVTGRQGEALGGAIVLIDEFGSAVATTTEGTYSLTVSPERTKGQTVTLRARYIGYSPGTKQITLTPGTQTQDFALKFDPMTLDAVVVTGVAEATEAKKLTFAVGRVDASQLQQAPGVSALGSLEGKVAGARLIQASGAPGGEPAIRLRGGTALTSAGSCPPAITVCASTTTSGPLIIVDGIVTRHGLRDMSAEDIERVEVVKGAAASSLYGSSAANGVVQIFTKRGDRIPEGKLSVTVRNEYGQSFRPAPIPVSLSHPFLTDANGNYVDENGAPVDSAETPAVKDDHIADTPYRVVYDQQERILTHGPFYTNYISIGQRRGNTNFNMSFQNTRQEGVMILLKGYNRQNFRVNVDQALTPRLDLSVGGFFGKSTNNQASQGPGSPFFAVTFVEPNIDLFAKNPDGTPYVARIPFRLSNAENPLYRLANEQIHTDRSRFTGNFRANYRLLDWLAVEANYNYDEESSAHTDEEPKNFLDATGKATDGQLVKIDSGGRSFNTGATLTSVRTFRLGSWNVRNITKAAYGYFNQARRILGDTGYAFKVARTPEFNAVDLAQVSVISQDITIRERNYYFVSGFDIKDRYLVDGLVRRDGSSLFGVESRWATYFRVSGAWRVTEDFRLKGIDELRLRGGYGTAGLRPAFDAQYETFAIVGGVPVKQTLGNPTLKPAHSAETELGLNIDFLGRFSLEYSYSRKETRDQILLVPVSAPTGYLNQWRNAGTLVGKTHELALAAILVDRPEFSWRLNVAGDRTRQKITELNTPPYLVGPAYANQEDVTTHFRIAAGETFGVIYGTKTVRSIAELYDDPAKQALSGVGQAWSPDSVLVNEEGYVVRRNAWQTINERPLAYVDPQGNTSVKIADVNPDFNLSFTTNLRYKNFTAYALLDWVQGGKIYNGTRQWPFFDYRDRVYDQSSKPAAPAGAPYSTGKKPIDYYNFFYNGINPVDFFVENGTYVKIKELNVSYNIGRSTLEKLRIGGVSGVKIGVIGRNLFTFTDYTGYDPEVAGLSGDPYSFRFDGFSYPNFRTFTGVVEINF